SQVIGVSFVPRLIGGPLGCRDLSWASRRSAAISSARGPCCNMICEAISFTGSCHSCSGLLPSHTQQVILLSKVFLIRRPSASYSKETSLPSGRTTFCSIPLPFHS